MSTTAAETPGVVQGVSRTQNNENPLPRLLDLDLAEEVSIVGRLYVLRENSNQPRYVVRIIDDEGRALFLKNNTVQIVRVPEENRTREETHSLPPWVSLARCVRMCTFEIFQANLTLRYLFFF